MHRRAGRQLCQRRPHSTRPRRPLRTRTVPTKESWLIGLVIGAPGVSEPATDVTAPPRPTFACPLDPNDAEWDKMTAIVMDQIGTRVGVSLRLVRSAMQWRALQWVQQTPAKPIPASVLQLGSQASRCSRKQHACLYTSGHHRLTCWYSRMVRTLSMFAHNIGHIFIRVS